ncbi:hypothetical protein EDD15DRAFT_2197753 [Pisolithus albus]|nr:hypothetical protein EDD15DRAFT_2197753 [Pisolithus albus]
MLKQRTWTQISAELPDLQFIRQSVSTAQSQSSVNPPPVIAMLNSTPNMVTLSRPMPPPLLATAQHKFAPGFQSSPSMIHSEHPPGGPSVHVPSAWQKCPSPANPRASGHIVALPPGSTSYNVQHMQYAAQCEHWVHMAHNPPPAETISLEIWAVFEGGGKKKNLRNICEGLKDIDALSTAHELAAIAQKTLVPRIKAYCPQFQWREDVFIVHDSKWVDLGRHPSPQSYFYNDCLHASNWKGLKAMVFKSKQFMLFVIVPANQWEEFEAFQEKLHSSPPTHARPMLLANPCPSSLARSTVSTPGVSHRPLTSAPSTPLLLSKEVISMASRSVFEHPISQDVLCQDGNKFTVTSTDMRIMSGKHHHHHSSSASSGSTSLPPQKKTVTTFSSPNRDQLKEALQSGGASEFDVNSDLFPGNVRPPDISRESAKQTPSVQICADLYRLTPNCVSIQIPTPIHWGHYLMV